jgi:hypothetical protein
MKKIFAFCLFVIVFQGGLFAQDDEFRTIFGERIRKVGGFGGPMMSFTQFNDEFAHMMGGGGGILLNRQLFFGGYGMGMTTPISPESPIYKGSEFHYGHGGFWYGLVISPASSVHPAISLQTGWGNISIEDEDDDDWDLDDLDWNMDNHHDRIKDNVFIINPALEIEFNITKFFKMGLGANYRFVFGTNKLIGYSDKDFSSPGGFVSFKFGWFD